MKKSKKTIGIVLSLILIIATVTTVLVATANTKETDIVITVDKTELSAGQSATVSVKVTSNYPIATMSIPVFYDKTLVDVSNATATLTDYAVSSAITDAESKDSSKVYANTGISSDKFGFVLATYIGGAGKAVPETVDSVVLTFKITAKTGVSGTEVIKCVSKSAKTDENIAGMLYFGSPSSGRTINSIPENIENIDLSNASANVKIGAEPNTIMLKEDAPFEAIIDTVNCGEYNGTIYGFDTLGWNDAMEADGAIADFITTAYGDDYLEIIDVDGVETTGALINVLDENGDVVERYVYIYFGDVNGDGLVDNGDSVYMDTYGLMFEGIDDLIQLMAADVSGDGMVDNADSVYSNTYGLMFEGMPTQAELGEMNVNNVYEMV
ncbi:MAG: hypothetical protein IKV25_00555 [Clostridia bacterium]|nr:hypothetical protein [Clostridia bacterium]